MTQPCVVTGGTALIPGEANPALLRRWLAEVLNVPKPYLERYDAADRVGTREEKRVRRVIELAIVLSNTLLRQSGVSTFDNGQVLELRRAAEFAETDIYRFRVALPAQDGVRPSVIIDGFANSLRMMTGLFTGAPDRERVLAHLEGIEEKVIKPLCDMLRLSLDGVAATFTTWKCGFPERPIGNGLRRVGWGARSRLMKVSAVQSDAAIAATISRNKAHTASFLRTAGLPAPDHIVATSEAEAIAAAAKLGWPLVVKPASAERSMGVHIDIDNESKLAKAFADAQRFSKHTLVERRVPGFCYRIAMCGDDMLFARAHKPKGLTGDGKLTIAELAEKATKNRKKLPPWQMIRPFVIDEVAEKTLSMDGRSAQTVPAKGEFVRLRPIIHEGWGAEFENVTDRIHPDNVEASRLACRAMGLTIAGVDMISPDIAVPWHENGAIINEINYMPQILKDVNEDGRRKVGKLIVEGDGRIPIHFVTGNGDLAQAAATVRERLAQTDERAHVVAADRCEGPDGAAVVLRGMTDLFSRVLAMLGRVDVHSLIIAAPADAFATSGWPIDRLAKVHVSGCDEGAARAIHEAIDARIETGGLARL